MAKDNDPYSGQPKHLVMVNAPIIEITDSDCDKNAVQETIKVGAQVLEKADDVHKQFYREMIGTYVMHEGKFWPSLKPDTVFALSRFPDGYELYESTRGDNDRKDYYLYGFKSDGKNNKFTSPADFVMHAKWLAFGRPKGACECQYCSDNSQSDIHKRLKAATRRVKMPSVPAVQKKSSRKRKAGAGAAGTRAAASSSRRPLMKRVKLDPGEIQAKDYTGGTSTVSEIHKIQLQQDELRRRREELEEKRKVERARSGTEESN